MTSVRYKKLKDYYTRKEPNAMQSARKFKQANQPFMQILSQRISDLAEDSPSKGPIKGIVARSHRHRLLQKELQTYKEDQTHSLRMFPDPILLSRAGIRSLDHQQLQQHESQKQFR